MIWRMNKGVDLYPWLGGWNVPKYFRQWIKATKVVEACGKLHPSQARSQDLILGGR